ncbi:MAG: phosphate ABC transporter ATP-binding protein PstB [Ardenticatenaceae bacterium]|nr:phosphate ABC transporter ATP-binding protein PstB [Ardenticatenaceae bacterium]
MLTAPMPVAAVPSLTAPEGLVLNNLTPYYGTRQVVQPVTMTIEPHKITAIIGPSGCGKSTILRCLNRMHETIPGARVEGDVLLDGESLYAPDMDPTLVRRRVGMVFQQPNPLRVMSIYDNVAIGLRLVGVKDRGYLDQIVEQSLRQAVLWDEVKDKLQHAGLALSGGQQQRLCIARALAVSPEALLLDEPASALDPISTFKIEELLVELQNTYTIIIVTHNMQQAARIAEKTALFLVERTPEGIVGQLVEYDETHELFTNPRNPRAEAYITGRFG